MVNSECPSVVQKVFLWVWLRPGVQLGGCPAIVPMLWTEEKLNSSKRRSHSPGKTFIAIAYEEKQWKKAKENSLSLSLCTAKNLECTERASSLFFLKRSSKREFLSAPFALRYKGTELNIWHKQTVWDTTQHPKVTLELALTQVWSIFTVHEFRHIPGPSTIIPVQWVV